MCESHRVVEASCGMACEGACALVCVYVPLFFCLLPLRTFTLLSTSLCVSIMLCISTHIHIHPQVNGQLQQSTWGDALAAVAAATANLGPNEFKAIAGWLVGWYLGGVVVVVLLDVTLFLAQRAAWDVSGWCCRVHVMSLLIGVCVRVCAPTTHVCLLLLKAS